MLNKIIMQSTSLKFMNSKPSNTRFLKTNSCIFYSLQLLILIVQHILNDF